MTIRRAIKDDLKDVGKLFAEYRVFYNQDYSLDKSIEFLNKRLENDDSVIFMALDNDECVGFTQLYPSFTSIGMQEIWILNDLFVAEKHRQKGIAEMLISFVLNFSKETNRKKVILSTAYSNEKAQRLYERSGFDRTAFYNYEKLTL